VFQVLAVRRFAAVRTLPLILPILTAALAACSEGGSDCLGPLSIQVSRSEVFEGDEFTATATWPGDATGCPPSFGWTASEPLVILGVATTNTVQVRANGSGSATLNASAGAGEFRATRSIDVRPNEGQITMAIDGLGAGIDADVDLSGPNGFFELIVSSSTFEHVQAGRYTWRARPVLGPLDHRWTPRTDSGSFDLARNDHTNLALRYDRSTGQVDFEAVGVPDGIPGPFARLMSEDGFFIDIDQPRISIAIEPGRYSWESFETDTLRYRFTPDVFTGTFLVGAGADIQVKVPYTGQRGFLILEGDGLPSYIEAPATISTPVATFGVTIPGADFHSAASYALDVPDLIDVANTVTDQTETYRAFPGTQTISLLGGQILTVTLTMHRMTWYGSYTSTVTVSEDPFSTATLIALDPAPLLRVTVTSEPPTSPNAGDETITITGPAPWVTVAGPLVADSTFTATGSGTVAGYANVPVTFTGRLHDVRDVSGTLEMGSDTAPKGLPNGAVRYMVEGSRNSLTTPPPGSVTRSAAPSVDPPVKHAAQGSSSPARPRPAARR
jgi:hypothetical protein